MDTAQENTDQLPEESVYDAAIAPEPEAEAPVESGRARDEKGRFASKEEAPVEAVAEAPVEIEAPKEEKSDHRIPLTELLNEREKRQSEQRAREALQRELEQLRTQLQPKPEPTPVPDQFANPEAYNQYWAQQLAEQQQTVEERFRNQEANFSLRIAHMQHGKVFEEAYQALLDRSQEGDRAPAQLVAQSPDPGQALVDWYRRDKMVKEVGDDPTAYVQKKLEEALNDPAFLAKAIEKAKGAAVTQPTQIKIPPSLNRATSAARADDSSPMSDMQLYNHSIGR